MADANMSDSDLKRRFVDLEGLVKAKSNGKPPANGNGVWKPIALVALTGLMTGFSTWLLFARNNVTRDEMERFIASEIRPLISDEIASKAYLQQISVQLNAMQIKQEVMQTTILQMRDEVAEVRKRTSHKPPDKESSSG